MTEQKTCHSENCIRFLEDNLFVTNKTEKDRDTEIQRYRGIQGDTERHNDTQRNT